MATRLLSLATVGLVACADAPTDFMRCFDDEPRPLSVIVDSSLALPESFVYSCDGDAQWGDGACSLAPAPKAVLDGDLNLWLRHEGLVGWWPMIEATREDGARLCGVWFSDTQDEASCDEPVCAESGTVTLSRFPDAPSAEPLAVVVDVEFANGAHLRAEFPVPQVR
jgi:hypothetical protein